MQRLPISSSNLLDVGFDPATGTLEIGFTSGSVYQYYRVPASVHVGLVSASSPGSFFHASIKGRYGDTRVV